MKSSLVRLTAAILAVAAGSIVSVASARGSSLLPGLPSCLRSSQECIYVSPSGNDRGQGTPASPIQSLTRAQSLIRKVNQNMTGNVTVYLEGGTYRLARPLVLTARDSGAKHHIVTWTGVPGATAIISGADRISQWKLHNASKNIWVAHVPPSLNTRQIYVNGRRAQMAAGLAPVALTPTVTGYTASSPVMAHWRNPSQIEFVYTAQLGLMTQPICPVASIQGDNITMAEPCWENSNIRPSNMVGFGTLTAPSYVENAYPLLQAPGQFYLDTTAHKLYYIPRPGEDMTTADVEAPALQTLVSGQGTPTASIHNITFSNLQFSYATWMQPSTPEGFSEIQANFTYTGAGGSLTEGLCKFAPQGTCPYGAWTKEPGSVQFAYGQHIAFVNDRFVHLGAAGVNLDNGSQNDQVTGSVFTDISGNGLEIGNVNMPQATGADQTRDIAVTNNHLFGLPVEYVGGVAIFAGYVADTTISHNQIDHVPYSAISIGWGGWPDKIQQPPVPNFSHDVLVSDNLIYDYMLVLTDGGAVYVQGITGQSLSNGLHVTGNVIHDQLAWSYALKSDNGATYDTYSNNVMYNDDYEWSGTHYDYRANPGQPKPPTFDPQLVINNYWQNGGSNLLGKGVGIWGNTVIAGPSAAPTSIITNARITQKFSSTLAWRPAGASAPNPPARVGVLYATKRTAYVTWRPSFSQGDDATLSYTVAACPANEAPSSETCSPPVTITGADFEQIGYAVVPGLIDGTPYSFTVTAADSSGASVPSIPSADVVPSHDPSPLLDAPTGIAVHTGHQDVSIGWYPPKGSDCSKTIVKWFYSCRFPPLAYRVTVSNGLTIPVTGLRRIVISSNAGKVLEVVGGLTPGIYSFSITAITPAGVGPPAVVTSVSVGP